MSIEARSPIDFPTLDGVCHFWAQMVLQFTPGERTVLREIYMLASTSSCNY
jgi:hypothetical protein